ncbi:MAG: MaoC family dehydratase N-terminal domain-containing protein [Chloroflexi bacterium]|nr:MaoC family dehydratase N-terminal domain-containing protein [Chloroflexota bacterium]MCY3695552.1 MaoC family dehydratase N-terminal domain-containing protein [Chloroflexota bacterium]MXX30822.1 MaoC family dehydratase [Chloroflexota bacterium]MYD16660.1 MaoC family dehydratase [Chloroflexota bacterium]MYJ01751.1 MaoC family dehydratase [Chloroflexota bacterium]
MVRVEGPYDIESVRGEWVGRKSPVVRGRYPVEYDSIRRHCHMVEDTNPLFLDPEYGAQSEWGAVIAPPVMTRYFAGAGVWPPTSDEGITLMRQVPTRGERNINLNTEWEYLQPAKVGDHLSTQTEVIDIYEKSIKLDPRAVWIKTEMRITNQDGELVAVGTNTLCTHRTPEQVESEEGERPL